MTGWSQQRKLAHQLPSTRQNKINLLLANEILVPVTAVKKYRIAIAFTGTVAEERSSVHWVFLTKPRFPFPVTWFYPSEFWITRNREFLVEKKKQASFSRPITAPLSSRETPIGLVFILFCLPVIPKIAPWL